MTVAMLWMLVMDLLTLKVVIYALVIRWIIGVISSNGASTKEKL